MSLEDPAAIADLVYCNVNGHQVFLDFIEVLDSGKKVGHFSCRKCELKFVTE